VVFKWKDEHTPQLLDFMKDRECLWNKSLNTIEIKQLVKYALQKIVQVLKLPDLSVEEVKLKIKTIRTRYAAELAKVIKPEKSEGLYDIYVPKWFWFKQAHSFLCGIFFLIFLHSLIQ
jgi:hypothetical protein